MSSSLRPVDCPEARVDLIARLPALATATEVWRLRPEESWRPPLVESDLLTEVPAPALLRFPSDVASARRKRASLVIFPGGAYRLLAVVHEGVEIAEWANRCGMDAYVALTRCPCLHPGPLADAQRAIRLVRELERGAVGVCGFSAGGHLAGSVTFGGESMEPDDAEWGVGIAPDFAMMVYPVVAFDRSIGHYESGDNLLGRDATPIDRRRRSIDQIVKDGGLRAPLFLVHGFDDSAVDVENSLLLWRTCRSVKQEVELRLYAHGPHGIGMRAGHGPISSWPERAEKWIEQQIANHALTR